MSAYLSLTQHITRNISNAIPISGYLDWKSKCRIQNYNLCHLKTSVLAGSVYNSYSLVLKWHYPMYCSTKIKDISPLLGNLCFWNLSGSFTPWCNMKDRKTMLFPTCCVFFVVINTKWTRNKKENKCFVFFQDWSNLDCKVMKHAFATPLLPMLRFPWAEADRPWSDCVLSNFQMWMCVIDGQNIPVKQQSSWTNLRWFHFKKC